MKRGIAIGKDAATAIVLAGTVATAGFLLACATGQSDWTETAEPGVYNTTMWQAGDVDGEVGHPLNIGQPRMLCLPSRQWTASVRIVSGQLPPGVYLNEDNFVISGIPTERGHWIVRLHLYDIHCNGQVYQLKDYLSPVEVRFHITGSGRVIQ